MNKLIEYARRVISGLSDRRETIYLFRVREECERYAVVVGKNQGSFVISSDIGLLAVAVYHNACHNNNSQIVENEPRVVSRVPKDIESNPFLARWALVGNVGREVREKFKRELSEIIEENRSEN